ncbi:hypothetical protein G6F68_020694 [Rhizopus microsporus]|nr:hypothetical protein G6F68_020694 [Rhizopus microsporus]
MRIRAKGLGQCDIPSHPLDVPLHCLQNGRFAVLLGVSDIALSILKMQYALGAAVVGDQTAARQPPARLDLIGPVGGQRLPRSG